MQFPERDGLLAAEGILRGRQSIRFMRKTRELLKRDAQHRLTIWSRWFNLRSEEVERTKLMFAFYTLTSVGILWLEVSIAALFLGEYGAKALPLIYIASAGIGTGAGIVYSWMQKVLPLHRSIVLMSILMALPLLLFKISLHPVLVGGYTIFLVRLWLEAIYVVNDLNTAITANQLFSIREIKRTYPLISSGILFADVISGLSLPLLRSLLGLSNIILLACFMMLLGAGILFYLTSAYRQSFPDSARRALKTNEQAFTARQLKGLQHHYAVLVMALFILVQVLSVLLDFQYLGQLEQGMSPDKIADFLAVFGAVLGLVELLTQWFISGRAIERVGIFRIAALPPILLLGLSIFTLMNVLDLFVGVMILKFADELLRYTLVNSTVPFLFQPIPEANRNRIQSQVQGIAEPLASGFTGLGILVMIAFLQWQTNPLNLDFISPQSWWLIYTAIFASAWLWIILQLQAHYVDVLFLGSDRGHLRLSGATLPGLGSDLINSFREAETDEKRSSCIELLAKSDPDSLAKVLSPLLPGFSPELQCLSLDLMLKNPDPACLQPIQTLIQQPLPPEGLASALRYIWKTATHLDPGQLIPYLSLDGDAVVRSTAAALLLRHGDLQQKAQATDILRRMLTSPQEDERVMGCHALGDAEYLQSLRIYIPPLLQDRSLQVRCAMLEVIAATRLEEYYPALLEGLADPLLQKSAQQALVRLGDEAMPLLVEFAENQQRPLRLRSYAWLIMGQIGSPGAIDLLAAQLVTAWGATRRAVLQVLLRIPHEAGVEAVVERIGRQGIETLITQELQLLAHLYASLIDFERDPLPAQEATMLCRALRHSETDTIDRIFLLMRLLYGSKPIQMAALCVQSSSKKSIDRGVEIIDNTIDLPCKPAILTILEGFPDAEKLQSLAYLIPYQPALPDQRLRHCLELRHFLSDWTLACCFHLARVMHWFMSRESIAACLRHPVGFVREAALAYLHTLSPQTAYNIATMLRGDSNPLVIQQVEQILSEFEPR